VLTLFVDGHSHACAGSAEHFARQLCASDHLAIDRDLLNSKEALALIVDLLCQRSVAVEPDD
jgi:hypothetical protein